MISWAPYEHLKMWHNNKLINKMVDMIYLNIVIFSEDE